MKNTLPIHSDTLAKANKLAKRAARPYPHATRQAIRELRDEFLERLQDRLERKFPEVSEG
jgi:hypothetical protein